MTVLLSKIEGLMATFKLEAAKAATGNKAAGTRARVASNDLTAAFKEYRALSKGV